MVIGGSLRYEGKRLEREISLICLETNRRNKPSACFPWTLICQKPWKPPHARYHKGRECVPALALNRSRCYWILPESGRQGLERLNVRRLPALGTLHNVELHGLTFLQALEST